MPEPITIYGATDCDDTQRTRERLQALGVPFREVNIDYDPEAACLVRVINGGNQSTPTVVIGSGRFKRVITEPTNAEIDCLAAEAGYSVPSAP